MSNQLFSKLAATFCILAPIALNTGCGSMVVGPERSTPQVQKTAPTDPTTTPELLPQEPTYAPREADLTGDGFVDASDLAAFAATLAADLNGDRRVDFRDERMLGAVLAGAAIDLYGDGFIDASDYAAYAYAHAHADLTHNGFVDASDLAAFEYLRNKGDVNRDSTVDSSDLALIRKHIGQQIEPPSKVS